jgi:hypothetical protein
MAPVAGAGEKNRILRPVRRSVHLSLLVAYRTREPLRIPLVFSANAQGWMWVAPGGLAQKFSHGDREPRTFRYPSRISNRRPCRFPSRRFSARTGEFGFWSPWVAWPRNLRVGTADRVRAVSPFAFQGDVYLTLHPAGF